MPYVNGVWVDSPVTPGTTNPTPAGPSARQVFSGGGPQLPPGNPPPSRMGPPFFPNPAPPGAQGPPFMPGQTPPATPPPATPTGAATATDVGTKLGKFYKSAMNVPGFRTVSKALGTGGLVAAAAYDAKDYNNATNWLDKAYAGTNLIADVAAVAPNPLMPFARAYLGGRAIGAGINYLGEKITGKKDWLFPDINTDAQDAERLKTFNAQRAANGLPPVDASGKHTGPAPAKAVAPREALQSPQSYEPNKAKFIAEGTPSGSAYIQDAADPNSAVTLDPTTGAVIRTGSFRNNTGTVNTMSSTAPGYDERAAFQEQEAKDKLALAERDDKRNLQDIELARNSATRPWWAGGSGESRMAGAGRFQSLVGQRMLEQTNARELLKARNEGGIQAANIALAAAELPSKIAMHQASAGYYQGAREHQTMQNAVLQKQIDLMAKDKKYAGVDPEVHKAAAVEAGKAFNAALANPTANLTPEEAAQRAYDSMMAVHQGLRLNPGTPGYKPGPVAGLFYNAVAPKPASWGGNTMTTKDGRTIQIDPVTGQALMVQP